MNREIQCVIQISLAFLTALIFVSYSPTTIAQAKSLDHIVVIVNDGVITESELSQAINKIKKQIQASHASLPLQEDLRKQVLDQLINKKLQLQVGEQMGVVVKEADLDNTIKNIADRNKISVPTLYQAVEDQGISKKEYRDNIREELTIQKIEEQAIGAKLAISPKEVDEMMHSKLWQASNSMEYHLNDILIPLPETPSSKDMLAAKKQAELLAAKVRGGMKFSDASSLGSSDTAAMQGADLGWRRLPEIPSAFAEEIVHMKPHEILGPVSTANGYHIVLLAEVRHLATKNNLAEQRKQIQELIFHRKVEENLQKWIAKLRSEAFINMNPEL